MTGAGALPRISRGWSRLNREPPSEGAGSRLNRLPGKPRAKSRARKRPPVLSDWIIARTKGRRERYAKRNIEKHGYETFLPDYQLAGSSRVEPLFPGYIFVHSPEGQWRFLEGTYGVSGIVMMGESAARVPLRDMRQLLKMCDKEGTVVVPAEKFRKGDRIKVKKGSFQGLLGLYIGAARDRVDLLFSILGREVPLRLPKAAITGALSDIEKASLGTMFPRKGNGGSMVG